MYNYADKQEDKEKSYIELDSTETEIIKYLNDNYKDVILLVKSSAAMELDWLKQYPNIKAVVYSQNVTNALAKVFSGEVNPSGRTVGHIRRGCAGLTGRAELRQLPVLRRERQSHQIQLCGLRGRYLRRLQVLRDPLRGQGPRSGQRGRLRLRKEVVYPFGYGLSYTDFKWSDFSVARHGNDFVATMTVTNTGDTAGKDVVELYAQSPYTDYDKRNAVEKASVNLVGYGKTSELKPGTSETVRITFGKDQLKAYDYKGAKTYILDAGQYRFTAATDANQAVNNILADKGKTVADGMTSEGDKTMVASWTPENTDVDTTTFASDSTTGKAISNLFDAASDPEVAYLSRSDWTGTFPKHYGESSGEINTWGNEINCKDSDGNNASCTWKKTASTKLIKQLEGNDSGTTVDKDSIMDTPTFGKKNGLKVSDMRGLAYDDAQWDKILDELTEDDYNQLIYFSGFGIHGRREEGHFGRRGTRTYLHENLQETQEGAGSDY